jgi:hypothetical protein
MKCQIDILHITRILTSNKIFFSGECQKNWAFFSLKNMVFFVIKKFPPEFKIQSQHLFNSSVQYQNLALNVADFAMIF